MEWSVEESKLNKINAHKLYHQSWMRGATLRGYRSQTTVRFEMANCWGWCHKLDNCCRASQSELKGLSARWQGIVCAEGKEWHTRADRAVNFAIVCFQFGGYINLRSGVFFFLRTDEARGKKNYAWYICLTCPQPPSNLNKQTSALPVKLMGQSAFTGSQPLCVHWRESHFNEARKTSARTREK